MYRFLLTAVILLWGGILPSNAVAETFFNRQTEHFILTFTAQDEKIAARLIQEIEKIRQAIIRDTGHDFPGLSIRWFSPANHRIYSLHH